jgi:hypothetical protein
VTPTLETNRTEYAASKTSNKSIKCNGTGRTRVEQARAKSLSVVHKNKKNQAICCVCGQWCTKRAKSLFVVCVDSVCWFLFLVGTPTLETNRNEYAASRTSNKSIKCSGTGRTQVEQARAKSLSAVHKNKKNQAFYCVCGQCVLVSCFWLGHQH